MSLSTGQVLNQRYRIAGLLGQGGFGAVYRAWDLNVQAAVAVKECLQSDPESIRQFQTEAGLLFKLRHTGLPVVHDSFSLPGQGSYLVMDFVEGEDLKTKLEQAGGPLPEGQAMAWIEQICDALIYLHSQTPPVIHRDIKPANIRITPQGKAILVDFGIAKLYDPQRRTTRGAQAATPGYAPPEQYGAGSTDARSDLYALGATAYHLLTGEAPPPAMDITAGSLPPPPPAHVLNPAVSLAASQAVGRAMQLRRDDRFHSARAFKAALGQSPAVVAPTLQAGLQPWNAGEPPEARQGSAPGYPYLAGQTPPQGATPPGSAVATLGGQLPQASYPYQPGYTPQPGYASQPGYTPQPGYEYPPAGAAAPVQPGRRAAGPPRLGSWALLVGLAGFGLCLLLGMAGLGLSWYFGPQGGGAPWALPPSATATPIPTPMPATPLPPPATPTTVIQPTFTSPPPLPSFTPTLLPSPTTPALAPDDFVRAYYQAINDRNYDQSWSMLSESFKERVNPTGFGPYTDWWDTVARVDVLTAKIQSQNDQTASVTARLRYTYKDGRVAEDSAVYELVAAPTEFSWWIEAVR
jgi:serine/threonine-protein kinase